MLKHLLASLVLFLLVSCGDHSGHIGGNREYNVTTTSGDGTAGNTDGNGSSSQMNGPSGVTVATDGTVWMTDENNNSVRMYDPVTGELTTEANTNGAAGFVDGDAGTARFDRPDGITVDSAGNVYVADTGNNAIRRIDAGTGNTTTIAGDGTTGNNDGAIGGATFDGPTGIVVDNDDDNILYVADGNNHTIRKIDMGGGTVSTIVGSSGVAGDSDANGTSARLNGPHAITIDADGNIYFSDHGNHKVKKFHKISQDVSTVMGNGMAGDGDQLNSPHGVAVDDEGNVFVADEGNNKVKRVTVGSIVSTIAGTGEAGFSDAVGTLAKMNTPTGLAIDTSGTLYLCDYNNNRIRKLEKR